MHGRHRFALSSFMEPRGCITLHPSTAASTGTAPARFSLHCSPHGSGSPAPRRGRVQAKTGSAGELKLGRDLLLTRSILERSMLKGREWRTAYKMTTGFSSESDDSLSRSSSWEAAHSMKTYSSCIGADAEVLLPPSHMSVWKASELDRCHLIFSAAILSASVFFLGFIRKVLIQF